MSLSAEGCRRKDLIDDEILEAQERMVEECGHCRAGVRVVGLMGKPMLGMMALRVACVRCDRSWGTGMGNDAFWREDD